MPCSGSLAADAPPSNGVVWESGRNLHTASGMKRESQESASSQTRFAVPGVLAKLPKIDRDRLQLPPFVHSSSRLHYLLGFCGDCCASGATDP